MQIAITGVSRGLGKMLKLELEENGNKVIGLDRDDTKVFLDRKKEFYKKIQNIDVFINNAHDGWLQINLLYDLYENFKDKKIQIINIGSVTSDLTKNIPNIYNIQKKSLEDACKQLQNSYQYPLITLVKFGWVDTEMVRHINKKKLPSRMAAKKITSLIVNAKKEKTYIKSITIDTTYLKV